MLSFKRPWICGGSSEETPPPGIASPPQSTCLLRPIRHPSRVVDAVSWELEDSATTLIKLSSDISKVIWYTQGLNRVDEHDMMVLFDAGYLLGKITETIRDRGTGADSWLGDMAQAILESPRRANKITTLLIAYATRWGLQVDSRTEEIAFKCRVVLDEELKVHAVVRPNAYDYQEDQKYTKELIPHLLGQIYQHSILEDKIVSSFWMGAHYGRIVRHHEIRNIGADDMDRRWKCIMSIKIQEGSWSKFQDLVEIYGIYGGYTLLPPLSPGATALDCELPAVVPVFTAKPVISKTQIEIMLAELRGPKKIMLGGLFIPVKEFVAGELITISDCAKAGRRGAFSMLICNRAIGRLRGVCSQLTHYWRLVFRPSMLEMNWGGLEDLSERLIDELGLRGVSSTVADPPVKVSGGIYSHETFKVIKSIVNLPNVSKMDVYHGGRNEIEQTLWYLTAISYQAAIYHDDITSTLFNIRWSNCMGLLEVHLNGIGGDAVWWDWYRDAIARDNYRELYDEIMECLWRFNMAIPSMEFIIHPLPYTA